MIGDPWLLGGVQLIVTMPSEKLVVGAIGISGFWAAKIETTFE
jgi:uncharacterized protein GlcG (DUF336 family)